MLSPSPVVMQLSSISLPDVVSHLSPRCGFPDVASRSGCCLFDICLLPLSQMWSPTCLLDVVSQMLPPGLVVVQLSVWPPQLSPRYGFFDVFSQLPPGFFHVLSSNLTQYCLQIAFKAFLNSNLFLGIGLPMISTCLSFVAQLFPSCLPNILSHLSPRT